MTGFGNGRQLAVSHVSYNDYSDMVRCLQLNSHLESTLFCEDQRGWPLLSEKILRHVRDGDLSMVACMTRANRFVKCECNFCGDYVRAKHSKHERREQVAQARCSVLYFFQFSNEMDPQPERPSV